MNGRVPRLGDEERRHLTAEASMRQASLDEVNAQHARLCQEQRQWAQEEAPILVGDLALHHEVVDERAEAIEQIARDVEQVSDLMRLLQYMLVEEQAPLIERIDEHLECAAINTERATREVAAANQYHKGRTRANKLALKTLLIVGGGALVGTGVGVAAGSALLGLGVGIAASTGSAAFSML